MALSPDEVLAQSKAAFAQWDSLWSENCAKNGELYRINGWTIKDLLYSGCGKRALLCATGPSFEKYIDIIKQHKDNPGLDIICVDKCLGFLLDHGIKPKMVVIADAVVDFNEWCAPWIEQTVDIILVSNTNSNTEWTHNWKGKVYFYINQDNIQSEKKYSEISGCKEFIPASSNVGNTVVVFSTQIMGYDEFYLVGYDFGWKSTDNYYAFRDSEKRYWMKHATMIDNNGDMISTSQNLLFSAKWLTDFWESVLSRLGVRLFNCSGSGILGVPVADLAKKLSTAIRRKLTDRDKEMIMRGRMEEFIVTAKDGEAVLREAVKKLNVIEVKINHIPDEVVKWLS